MIAGVHNFDTIAASLESSVSLILITMSLPEERHSYKDPLSPVGRMQSSLAASFVTPSPKTNDGDANQFVDDEPFIDKMKPTSMTVAKGVLNNDEHTLIPVTAKMIHSAVWDSKRFVLKDSRMLHMVNLVGAIMNFGVTIKHVQNNVEHGTGLVRVIVIPWQKEKECMAQCQLIHECNSNRYICVIGEVEDYYGVQEIIAFNV